MSSHTPTRPPLVLAVAALLLAAGCSASEEDPRIDAGPAATDAGHQPDAGKDDLDAGEQETDAGEDETDAGEDETDAGEDETDAGEDETDAGEDETDAGEQETDAGEGETDAGEQPEALADDEISEAYLEAVCSVLVRCGIDDSFFLDRATCLTEIGTVFNDGSTFGSPDALEASVKAGAVTFDGVKALDCFESVRAITSCDPEAFPLDLRQLPACAGAFVGAIETGENCIVNEACASDAACMRGEGDGICAATCVARPDDGCLSDADCDGVACRFQGDGFGYCATLSGEGEACDNGDQSLCEEGLACVWSDGEPGESGFICIKPPEEGDPCTGLCAPGLACQASETEGGLLCAPQPSTLDAICQPESGCGGNFRCVNQAPEAMCEALPVAGESCSLNGPTPCAAGHYCADTICQALAEAGEPCTSSAGCVEGLDCVPGEEGQVCGQLPATELADCSATGACGGGFVCLPDGDNGMVCQTTQVGTACNGSCSPGQACDYSADPPSCVALPVEGDCINNQLCAEGSFCDYSLTTCVVRRDVDEPCQYNDQCASALVCNWSFSHEAWVCQQPAAEGESCEVAPCQAGLTCEGHEERTCQRSPGLGESCQQHGVCDEDSYCNRPSDDFRCQAAGGENEPCLDGGVCSDGLLCADVDTDGEWMQRCVPTAGEGEACALEGDGVRCVDGLVCLPTVYDLEAPQPKCFSLKREGEACTNLLQCGSFESALYCDVGGTDTCVARPGPGEPCLVVVAGMYSVCHPLTAYCADGEEPTCAAFKAAGEPCESELECGGEIGFGDCVEAEEGRVCMRRVVEICEP